MPDDDPKVSRLLRFDTLIAVSALLISSLTAAASLWQSRIIQQQLSAQVWPYVSISENFNGSAFSLAIINNGLGPAILESANLKVDGKQERTYVDALHVLLGPNLVKRKPRKEKISLTLAGRGPGDVLRSGETETIFTLSSKHFAPLLLVASSRISIDLCYCAIIPDTCWLEQNSTAQSKPKSQRTCPEIRDDLLHASLTDELRQTY